MRPIYIFAILAVLFVIYTQQQKTTATQTTTLELAQLKAQSAIAAANSPAGMINTVVGGLGNLASLTGFGLD
jgi:hypothetical protein